MLISKAALTESIQVCDTEENREAAHLVPRLKRQGRLTNIDTEAPEHLAAMGLFNSVGSMWSFMKYTRSLVVGTHLITLTRCEVDPRATPGK